MNKSHSNYRGYWICVLAVLVAASAALHVWQYGLLLDAKSKHAYSNDGVDYIDSNAIVIDGNPGVALADPDEGRWRRESLVPDQSNEAENFVDCEEALEGARGEIVQLQRDLATMHQAAWDVSVRTSLWDTEVSVHASKLLTDRGYSDRAIEAVNVEVRNSLSGMKLSDEEILWMGDCAESGNWPELDSYGEKNIFLSLARKMGPERIAREVSMHALHSLLRETPEEDVLRLWGEHLKTAYLRLPPLPQASLRSKFPGEFDDIGH